MEHVAVFQKGSFSFFVLLLVLFLLAGGFLSLATQKHVEVAAQTVPPVTNQPANVQYQNHAVYIGLWLINIYSFDYRSGSYTFDFYVYFAWVDPNISTADWYLMNGYPAYPGAKLLVSSNYTSPLKYELYRVRADLNTPLEAKNYPFDKIKLAISIELLSLNYSTSLVWLPSDTGIGTDFQNVGWTKPTFELATSTTSYPENIQLPRADMFIDEARNTYGATVETIVPPLIFCVVSAISFLFQMHENSAFSLRVGITTSMLITAVLFNIAQQNNLPPLTSLTFYDVFIDSVISFLAISLIVNILGYVEWMRNGDKKRVNELNKWGFVASVGIPVILFVALFLLK